MTYWFISFADADGFRGATVVEASSPPEALAEAARRGINPGGEAVLIPVLPGDQGDPIMKALTNRLVGSKEMDELGAVRVRNLPTYIQDQFDGEITIRADLNPKIH